MYGNRERIVVILFVIADLFYSTTADLIQPKIIAKNSVESLVNVQSDGTYMAERGQFTYQVAIRSNSGGHCAGALLSDRWALSSAYCVNNNQREIMNLRLIFGGYDIREGYSYICESIKVHELFTEYNFEYDVALLKTDRQIIFNEFVQPIPYFKGGAQEADYCSGNNDDIVTIGWGSEERKNWYLQYSSLTVYTNAGCRAVWNEDYWFRFLASSSGCAYSNSSAENICNAELGLPLVTLRSRVLVGILAGYYRNNCDNPARPIIFTRTSSLAKWIFRNTNVEGVDTM